METGRTEGYPHEGVTLDLTKIRANDTTTQEIFPVKINLLHPDAKVPKRGSLDAAGYDLYCIEEVRLIAGLTAKVRLGFSTEMPYQIHGRIEARSGLALKGVAVVTGVIDADYRGEWCVIMHYLPGSGENMFLFAPGDKVAQVVFRPTVAVHFEQSAELSDTARGAGGFGSSGR
jgi:dUTP pyrophosphatase